MITRFERSETDVKVSDISDELGLPRPGVTKTIKDMERLGFCGKEGFRGGWTFCVYQEHSGWQRLVGKYVDEYFTGLGESLTDITDEDADIMIATIEKIYDVMAKGVKT